jgi:hypothetical protein
MEMGGVMFVDDEKRHVYLQIPKHGEVFEWYTYISTRNQSSPSIQKNGKSYT